MRSTLQAVSFKFMNSIVYNLSFRTIRYCHRRLYIESLLHRRPQSSFATNCFTLAREIIWPQVRYLTVSPFRYTKNVFLNENDYEEIADYTLDTLSEKLEIFLDKLDDKTYDVMLNNGVITLSLGDKGTYVINKQTPNRQIWLSSPLSGPKRYDYIDGVWAYKHDGQSLQDLLKQELENIFNVPIDFSIK